jgi:phage terminase large subunit-like protein
MELTSEERAALQYSWGFWGRPNQQEPRGDWLVWLLLAGRGFGKTRTGAEWVINQARENPDARLALVGATAADVRDVMIRGNSGILACSPPWFYPDYEPSKRLLTWPNGAIATAYSADTPDRLRGPQHTQAWCLAGDTRVRMHDGSERRLDALRVGDGVLTRAGPRRVTGAALTRKDAEVWRLVLMDGQTIDGTAEHPVWVHGRGFLPMASLKRGMQCVTLASSGAGIGGTATAAGITSARTKAQSPRERAVFIGLYGKWIMGRCLRAAWFTISTTIRQTIGSKISLCLHAPSTARYTATGLLARMLKKGRLSQRFAHSERRASAGITSVSVSARAVAANIAAGLLSRAAFAPQNAPTPPVVGALKTKCAPAYNAARRTLRPDLCNVIAASAAIYRQRLKGLLRSFGVMWRARYAAGYLPAKEQTQDFATAPAPCVTTVRIQSVEKLAKRIDVYDIAVDGQPEFFANDILVHNCDEVCAWTRGQDAFDQLMLGLRLGQAPRCVITTTPRPIKLLKNIMAAKDTHITSGSTYDNLSNLAPTFKRTILEKYEGTRIGLQELRAQVLEFSQNALWHPEMLENCRVTFAPKLRRVVVGVDPATSSDKEKPGNNTGIVAAGIGYDGLYYVLEDATLRDKPHIWAKCAAGVYHARQADILIAEANQGGDLVATLLKVVDPTVAVRLIHASRGKALRAEPIAALYEQDKVRHVGTFLELEQEMCNFDPTAPRQGLKGDSDSPDRVDALVHCLAELNSKHKPLGQIHFAGAERQNPYKDM